MKIDANVKFIDLSSDNEETVFVDMDYVSNRDEIISYVEEELYHNYGISKYYGRDFEITNLDDLEEQVEGQEYSDEE